MSEGPFHRPPELPPPPTPLEALFRQAVRGRRHRAMQIRRQHSVGRGVLDGPRAEWLAIGIDGGCPTNHAAAEADRQRGQLLLAELGIHTLRIPAEEVEMHLSGALIGSLTLSPRPAERAMGVKA
jgi:very-short-patch-repair endonuclease